MINSPLQNTPGKIAGEWVQIRPRITQGFPDRPEYYAKYGLKGHGGLDFGTNGDDTIFAPFQGQAKVIYDKDADGKYKGFGLHIKIRDGEKECVLAHLSEVYITDGQQVYLGQKLGLMGSTGDSSAKHLHFGLRFTDNKGTLWSRSVLNYDNGYKGYIDPTEYITCWKGSLNKLTL